MTRLRPRPPRRLGKSLVELVTVLVIVSTVLLFVGRVMVGVFRVESRTSVDTLVGRTLDRLGARLRADVRDALSVHTLGDDGPAHGIHIARPNESVEYVFADGSITRTAGKTPEDADTHTDRYRLGGFDAEFGVVDRGAGVTLVVTRRPPVGEGTERRFVWRTEARPRAPVEETP